MPEIGRSLLAERSFFSFGQLTTQKIGFVLPLSGDWAFLGNGIRDGAIGNLSVKKDGVIWSEASVKEIRGGRVVGFR